MTIDLIRQLKVQRLEAKDRARIASEKVHLAGRKRAECVRTLEGCFEDLESDRETLVGARASRDEAEEEFAEVKLEANSAVADFRKATRELERMIEDLATGQSSYPIFEAAPGVPRAAPAEDPAPAPAEMVQAEVDDDQADEEPPPYGSTGWDPEVCNHELNHSLHFLGIREYCEVDLQAGIMTEDNLLDAIRLKIGDMPRAAAPAISGGLYGWRFAGGPVPRFWVGHRSSLFSPPTLSGQRLIVQAHRLLFGRDPIDVPAIAEPEPADKPRRRRKSSRKVPQLA